VQARWAHCYRYFSQGIEVGEAEHRMGLAAERADMVRDWWERAGQGVLGRMRLATAGKDRRNR
jgi:hypothetical protein